jgi:putative transposase
LRFLDSRKKFRVNHTTRKQLPHLPPAWVKPGALFFLTLCAARRGENSLCQPDAATRILDTARYHHEAGTWFCALILLMPDHLHAIAAFPPEVIMTRWVRSLKIYTTRGAASVAWQRNFFDHRLRNETEVQLKTEYVRQNPVRAALTPAPDTWPWQWSPR